MTKEEIELTKEAWFLQLKQFLSNFPDASIKFHITHLNRWRTRVRWLITLNQERDIPYPFDWSWKFLFNNEKV